MEKYSQVMANGLDNKLHEDAEQLRKFGPTEGCATSGVFVFETSTPRPQAGGVILWVCPGSNKSVGFVC